MTEKIIKFQGQNNGSRSLVLVGVHGDEICGIEAVKKILPRLKIVRGVVCFGFGNPRAIRDNKRYIDANLNRMFRQDEQFISSYKNSYEYERAQFLKYYLNRADALLDIHASSVAGSPSFVICEAGSWSVARFLPTNLLVSGFDDIEPGGTDYYMNRKGKMGMCFECGDIKNPQAIKTAEQAILTFLSVRGHIKYNFVPLKQTHVRMYKKYYAQTDNFVLSRPFGNFELVARGQLIGKDGQREIRAPKKSLILFAHNGVKAGDEIFLLGETEKPC